MRNIRLVIQYDGTRYKGWQRLGDNDHTIQAKIESVLSKMTGETIEIIGSGRTDAGVHALGQVTNFRTNSSMSIQEIQDYCYRYLPEDIVIKSVKEAGDKFHARYNATRKKYIYKIWNHLYHDPFNRKYITHITEPLNIDLMKEAADALVGLHDFTSFTTAKSKKKSMVREIYAIDIMKNGNNIEMLFQGNGFLHNMIRIIVGTLIEVGLGRIEVKEVKAILHKKDRKAAGATAPPQGLFLYDVDYK
ncbi:tRNA pseudouridine(38-40) synthase TruA [Clostridiaceae bacterium 35-E11]